MKRIFPLLLIFALLLPGCRPAGTQAEAAPAADEVARAALAVCGRDAGGLERLDTQLDGDGLTAYLTNFYRLPEGSWDDCAIYRGAASEAFEVAVIRLAAGTDSGAVYDGLTAYRLDRQGDFTGYDPEQAYLAERGLVAVSAGGGCAALLICEEPDAALTAFLQALGQSAPLTTPAPSPTTDPAVYAGRTPYTDPEIDDMTIYDTSAILAAWRSADPSALSEYDRTIYDRAADVLETVLTDGMSDYQKEKAVYQWVVTHVRYDYDHYDNTVTLSPDSSTPYNPLTEGKGICLGFSVTFQLLMDMAGVECVTVVGAAFSSREDHAWNMVRLNGEWYCVDATWDAGKEKPARWSYFNVTSDWMADTDHQWDYASVPEATAADGGRG